MPPPVILAIDQGTTSTRAVVYDAAGRSLGSAAKEFKQHYPQPGWVEHDPEEIWQTVGDVVPQALTQAEIEPRAVTAIGITNQRETSVVWERAGGKTVAPALVWQDRRTTDFCRQRQGDSDWLREKTGLVLDPYFSATKIRWLLENDAGLRRRAEQGQLAWGTVDSFLIWRLTGGKAHLTDRSNASRSLLLNLRTAAWDDELCRYFSVPRALLPEVRPSACRFGVTAGLGFLPDGIPITGNAGDQQAALFGQFGFAAGDAKCTYGTGAFFLLHTGGEPVLSKNRLLSTLAASGDGPPQYALEGSVFVAGAAVQWLRDGLKLFDAAPKVEGFAARSDPEQPTLFVPAFVGLGAPYWVPEARGVIFGLTRGTTGAELSRAVLEGVALQVADLLKAAAADTGRPMQELRVDGGMAQNAWFLQYQADILGLPVYQAAHAESTALGAAFLAGLQVGVWPDLAALKRLAQAARPFQPRLPAAERDRQLRRWRRAIEAVIAFYTGEQ